VDFKNTIIILTSNLGSGIILDGIGPGGQLSERARTEVQGLLKRQFRPEFLNRLDEIVFYTPLSRVEIEKITELMLKDLDRRLSERRVTVKLSDEAKRFVIDNGYDPVYGARPLKRFIQRAVETPVARMLIASDVPEGSVLELYPEGDGLAVRIA